MFLSSACGSEELTDVNTLALKVSDANVLAVLEQIPLMSSNAFQI